MIRKFCMMMAVSMAIVGASTAPHADARGEPACGSVLAAEPDGPPPTPSPIDGAATDGGAIDCVDAPAYPGPFTNQPAIPAGPYAAPTIVGVPQPVPERAAVAGAANEPSTSSRDLAHSGTETFVLAYLGTGLLAFGAFAMGIRRGSRLPE